MTDQIDYRLLLRAFLPITPTGPTYADVERAVECLVEQLQRERDALKQEATSSFERIGELSAERDALRVENAKLQIDAIAAFSRLVQFREQAAQLLNDRDLPEAAHAIRNLPLPESAERIRAVLKAVEEVVKNIKSLSNSTVSMAAEDRLIEAMCRLREPLQKTESDSELDSWGPSA